MSMSKIASRAALTRSNYKLANASKLTGANVLGLLAGAGVGSTLGANAGYLGGAVFPGIPLGMIGGRSALEGSAILGALAGTGLGGYYGGRTGYRLANKLGV